MQIIASMCPNAVMGGTGLAGLSPRTRFCSLNPKKTTELIQAQILHSIRARQKQATVASPTMVAWSQASATTILDAAELDLTLVVMAPVMPCNPVAAELSVVVDGVVNVVLMTEGLTATVVDVIALEADVKLVLSVELSITKLETAEVLCSDWDVVVQFVTTVRLCTGSIKVYDPNVDMVCSSSV